MTLLKTKTMIIPSDIIEEDPIKKTKKQNKIVDLPGGSNKKNVYLIEIQPSIKEEKYKYFITAKMLTNQFVIDFVGCEITREQSQKIKSYDDAIKIANIEKNILHVMYPWHRINRIQNLLYKIKT